MKDRPSREQKSVQQHMTSENMSSKQPPAFQLKADGKNAAPQTESPIQKMEGEQIGGIMGGVLGAVGGFAVGGIGGAIGGGMAGYAVGSQIGLAAEPMGKFKVDQTNHDASAPNGLYSSDIVVTFSPNRRKVNSPEIAFVQNVRVIDKTTGRTVDPRDNFLNRKTNDEYTIDRVDDRRFGWYGYNNDGTPSGTTDPGSAPHPLKDATLTDQPQWNIPNTSWDFETTAIARSGVDAGKMYGSVTWGFGVDNANQLTSHPVVEHAKPSTEFDEAVAAWNAQAAGPAVRRNHPDQQPLGPFR